MDGCSECIRQAAKSLIPNSYCSVHRYDQISIEIYCGNTKGKRGLVDIRRSFFFSVFEQSQFNSARINNKKSSCISYSYASAYLKYSIIINKGSVGIS